MVVLLLMILLLSSNAFVLIFLHFRFISSADFSPAESSKLTETFFFFFFFFFADFNWDALSNFDLKANLHDLLSLDSLRNFQSPQNLGELYSKLDGVISGEFCDRDE